MKNLLIVHNNPSERDRLTSLLAGDVDQVRSAASVAEGLEAILDREIQVVILAGDYDDQHIARLVPLLKKCNRHLSIILVSDRVSLELLRRIRKEGIFYHALSVTEDLDQQELQQAVACAFQNYKTQTNIPKTIFKKEKTMYAKSLFTTLSLILLAVPAMAADTTKVYSSGLLVLLFVGFCALLVVAQLLPAVMNLMGMTKNVAKGSVGSKAHAKN
jgi:DNA-binding NtrC family response regulator